MLPTDLFNEQHSWPTCFIRSRAAHEPQLGALFIGTASADLLNFRKPKSVWQILITISGGEISLGDLAAFWFSVSRRGLEGFNLTQIEESPYAFA